MTYNDYNSQEKTLVAVDCVVFGYEDGELKLLLFQRQLEPEIGKWSLVGGWLEANESAEIAANRVLRKITGLDDVFLEQVKIFSSPNRDPGGRVLSVVFYSLLDLNSYDESLIKQYGAKWWSVSKLPNLIFDHDEMYKIATEKLRKTASYNLVGRDLLSREFTITQLRLLYNSIFSIEFDPGNFRKKILSLNAMNRLEKKDTSESKKGAYYYTFKSIDEIDVSQRIVKV